VAEVRTKGTWREHSPDTQQVQLPYTNCPNRKCRESGREQQQRRKKTVEKKQPVDRHQLDGGIDDDCSW
jgi:hypothetical protein